MLVRCHAGCDQRDVIAALRSAAFGKRPDGLLAFARNHRRRIADEPDAEALKRTEAALAIWQASEPAEGTPVAIYLRSRGLDFSRLLPPCASTPA